MARRFSIGSVWPLIAIAAMPLVLAGPAAAAEWRTSKQLAVKGTYTDNLNLNDDDKTGAFFVEFTPGIVLTGTGRRLNLNLAYSLQYLNYLIGDADDKINHRLQAGATSELIRDRFFVDGRVTARQELIDPLGAAGFDATTPSDNLQTTSTYSLGARHINRFGRHAVMTARAYTDGVIYSDTGDDSLGYGVGVDLFSGPAFGNLSLGVVASTDYTDYQDDRSDRESRVLGLAGYQFGPRWRVDGGVGYEDNDYGRTVQDTSGSIWEVSVTWTPSNRTLLRVGTGGRYFGSTPVLEFRHRRKMSVFTASFVRDATTARRERLASDVFLFEDPFGELVDPDTGAPVLVPDDTGRPTAEVYISNRFQVGYNLSTRRSTIGATVGYTLREYQGLREDEETTYSLRVFGSRRLTGLTSANAGIGWRYFERAETATAQGTGDREDIFFDAGLSRRLSPRSSLDLQYRHRSGDSTENRITLAFRTTWN